MFKVGGCVRNRTTATTYTYHHTLANQQSPTMEAPPMNLHDTTSVGVQKSFSSQPSLVGKHIGDQIATSWR